MGRSEFRASAVQPYNRSSNVRRLWMPLETTANIWHNGQLIPWEKAQIHVMSHVVHYGSSVFEGIRCYAQDGGAGVFRLSEHMQRLIHSAKIYRMPLPYSLEQLNEAVVEVIEANGVTPCYIRPIAFRGYGEIGRSEEHTSELQSHSE